MDTPLPAVGVLLVLSVLTPPRQVLPPCFIPLPHQPKEVFVYEEMTPVQMHTSITCNTKPLELGVRVGIETHDSFGAEEMTETNFKPLLTIDTFNISANGIHRQRDPSPGSSGRVRQSMDHMQLTPASLRKLATLRLFTDLRSAGGSPMSVLQMN